MFTIFQKTTSRKFTFLELCIDNAIHQLKPPLIKIKGDVELIESEINNGLGKVRNLLEKKKKILEKKLVLKHLMGLHENLIFLEQNDTNNLGKQFRRFLEWKKLKFSAYGQPTHSGFSTVKDINH